MINIIRKNQQALMIIITVLVIISFVWFYNGTRNSSRSELPDRLATVYGRSITQNDVDREFRALSVARALGLVDLMASLDAIDQRQPLDNYLFNVMVLRHEAGQLQIQPTKEQVKKVFSELPVFQTDGAFDPKKLAGFVSEKLAPNGFNDMVIDALIRDTLLLRQIKTLVGATASISPSEIRNYYEIGNRKTQVSVVRFTLDEAAAGVQISDEDAKKMYDQRKDGIRSPELRKVKFVTLALSDAEAALKGRERVDALQKLANKANDLTQAMLEKGAQFDAVAAKFQCPVSETGEFAETAPDAKFEKAPAAAAAAFKLTQEDPNSDVIQAGTAFYILHLESIVPSRPLSFEEAKAGIVNQLKTERAAEAISVRAGVASKLLQEALKAGKSFADAAKDQKLKVEAIPPFSLADRQENPAPDMQQIIAKSIEMNAGQLSELVQSSHGGMLIYVEKRLPVDEAQFEKEKEKVTANFVANKQLIAFREWLRTRREAAKIQFGTPSRG